MEEILEYRTLSKKEYLSHVSKLQEGMKKENLDLLLLSSPENIYYATGYRSWYLSSLFRPVWVLVPSVGEPSIILRILEKSTVKLTSWVPHIYCHGSEERNLGELQGHNSIEAFEIFLSDFDITAGRIGYEKSDGQQYFWAPGSLEQLMQEFDQFEYVDGTKAIQEARSIKSEWEIEQIREANRITEEAILQTFSKIIPGKTTELDISKSIAQYMTGGGIDKISYLTIISGDAKYSTFNSYASKRVVEEGEVVLVDISGHINGYASDLTRCIYLGDEVPKDIWEMALVASKSVVVGKEMMKSGEKISVVSQAIENTISEAQFGDYLVHNSGHGIGLNVVEYPSIVNNSEVLFEEGMVFAVENGVYPYDKNIGGESISMCIRMEDVVSVTKNGSEWLSGPGKPIYCINDFKGKL